MALDKSVAEVTDQRREENSDYKTLMVNNQSAKELLEFAKNRLNKFYSPKLYKPPAMFMQSIAHTGKLLQDHQLRHQALTRSRTATVSSP